MAEGPTDPATPQVGTAPHGDTPAGAPPTGASQAVDPSAVVPHAGAFQRATAVTPQGRGRYTCVFNADWAALAGINGGIIMATLIRAIEAELGTERTLRTLHCEFLRPPKAREADIIIETTRTGSRATNLRIRVEQDGRLMVDGLATCFKGDLREIASWSPLLPAEAATSPTADTHIADPRLPSIADRLKYTPVIGPPPMSGTPLEPGEPARTGGWIELLEPHPVDLSLVAFYLDAWWPAAMGPIDVLAFNPTIDMTFHARTALPPGGLPHQPLFVDFATQASLEGLVDEDARLFTADGQLIAEARQLAITLTAEDRPPVTKTSHASID